MNEWSDNLNICVLNTCVLIRVGVLGKYLSPESVWILSPAYFVLGLNINVPIHWFSRRRTRKNCLRRDSSAIGIPLPIPYTVQKLFKDLTIFEQCMVKRGVYNNFKLSSQSRKVLDIQSLLFVYKGTTTTRSIIIDLLSWWWIYTLCRIFCTLLGLIDWLIFSCLLEEILSFQGGFLMKH